MADRLIEHATKATNDRLGGATWRSEFMNSLTSIELFFKERLSRMRACARKLKNRSPRGARQFFKRYCRRCHRRLVVVRVVVRRALLRESRELGINQTYLPPARYHDNPSFDEYIYVPGKTRATRQSLDDQNSCDIILERLL